jgi:hypothetical protein
MSESLGWEAIAAVDQLLEDRPDKVGHDFSAATRRLATWRDALVQRQRHSPARRDNSALERVNAAISVILGGQFPLGRVPWPEIARVRQQLHELLRDEVDQPAAPTGTSSQTTRS